MSGIKKVLTYDLLTPFRSKPTPQAMIEPIVAGPVTLGNPVKYDLDDPVVVYDTSDPKAGVMRADLKASRDAYMKSLGM